MNTLISQLFGSWAAAVPTVTYCEQATTGFIARPGYAVSNIPYILFGIYLLIWHRDKKYAKEFGVIAILVGTASFIYDASFTFLAQTVDLAAMFLFITLLVGLSFQKHINLGRTRRWSLMALLTAIYVPAAVMFKGSSGRIIFGMAVAFVILSEFYLSLKNKRLPHRYFLIALGLFLVGFGIWLLDANQIWCDPTNLFNGRAVYHYLTAGSMYFLWKFYSNTSRTTE